MGKTSKKPVAYKRYQCTSDVSKYTNSYCELKGDRTGCYFVQHFSEYRSCGQLCNNVEQHSTDERRCNSLCDGFLSEYGDCVLVNDGYQTTSTARPHTGLSLDGNSPSTAVNKNHYFAFFALLLLALPGIIGIIYHRRKTKRKKNAKNVLDVGLEERQNARNIVEAQQYQPENVYHVDNPQQPDNIHEVDELHQPQHDRDNADNNQGADGDEINDEANNDSNLEDNAGNQEIDNINNDERTTLLDHVENNAGNTTGVHGHIENNAGNTTDVHGHSRTAGRQEQEPEIGEATRLDNGACVDHLGNSSPQRATDFGKTASTSTSATGINIDLVADVGNKNTPRTDIVDQ